MDMCWIFTEDRKMRSIVLVTFLFGVPLSCFAQEKLPGFESPEKAFHAYITGAVSQDFDLTLSSLTPEAKAYHIVLVVISVPSFFEKDEMEKLFHEHGIDLSGPAKEKADEQAAEKAFVDAMLKIKNPAKLVRTLAARQQKIAKQLAVPADPKPEPKSSTQEQLLSSVTLGKVDITEDSAVATVTVAASAKEAFSTMPKNVEFRRIKGRWYSHIDPR
jgi:hypothetical protein